MAGRVVYDSDDESDLSPPPTPSECPPERPSERPLDRPATPPRAMIAHMEPSPLPDTLSFTHPVVTSSTDASFFQTVYEEQQRELGAQLGTERDLWDVPSSPMRPPPARQPKQLGDGAKRKRDEAGTALPEPKRQQVQIEHPTQPAMSSGLEISIPLGPLTPSMMHQYPRMLSSSIDQSYPGEATYTLGHTLPALFPTIRDQRQDESAQPPPGDAITQSTVAFTTPSIYASSGRRALGSSSSANVNTDAGVHDRGADGSLSAADEVVTIQTSTPPMKARAAAAIEQIMSSPDIIAEPAPLREPQRQAMPQVDAEKGDDAGARPSARDEIDESDASELSFCPSPGSERGLSATAEKPGQPAKAPAAKPLVIAASDDEGGSPLSDIESDSSVKACRRKSNKAAPKAKKGRKRKDGNIAAEAPPLKDNAVVHIELPGQALVQEQQQQQQPQPTGKRPRGRPRQTAKKEYQGSDEHDGGLSEKTAAEPEAVLAAKPKGRVGRPKADKKNKKPTDDGAPSASVTALAETSGNAVSVSSASLISSVSPAGSVSKEEDSKPAAQSGADQTVSTAAAAAPTEDEKPAASKPAASGLATGLGIGPGTAGPARVLYRVGLSRNSRIAPLLKIVRK